MKNTLFAIVLISSSSMANQHQSFQNNFFDSGFNNSVWSNFNDQFQQFNNEMRSLQNKNTFGTQTNRYFDELTSSYIIEIAVKGLTKENLDISTKSNMIHINGNVQKIEKTTNSSHTSSSQFSQSYSLPNDADKNSISTKFKEDILVISIPKR
ncbi:hypothetical protein [uncultured Gammaproteobacteria bacterium]|uniref:Hsp20/alpha crystallin family protein n=1 Tax=Bathymodiolus heckerae thiotrophic gill symbiont TaxID=1052212 RepID=UPI0010BB64AA|nr:Hsp20/alpha crystallin family protein [Bathymodiolus heckerae thiotrophic gill symbiont]CAC9542305.1 hypothetical protein [uncultured Gammaproteobacteria bacterium]CAC9581358.1 hypothetical protein [uncultured Gammaproteobacteria bacterium]CAC9595879.1 hypothetical protein [uncultured Gammaproteobacteria bacterium]CAC9956691.1 hypothetical protein [uncultured Gammaproteobacteria bacterium]CAC9957410.1 hypothetical protein [uncultured Gammaproteobacteria bacterium]